MPNAACALRDCLDVALFTPGAAAGRPLALPVVPAGLGQLPEADREQLAVFAAAALAGMMGYKVKGSDPKLAILSKAIEVLALTPGRDVTVDGLRRLVEDRDDALVHAVDGFDAKHYKKLGEDLHSLALQRRPLLAAAAEPLDIDALLGRGPDARPGKTRLSIINTQFLGDPAAVEFWSAQLLLALDRWRAKNPAQQLQAVFLFDEADAYLPAIRQPATKAPMESLLRRRARLASACSWQRKVPATSTTSAATRSAPGWSAASKSRWPSASSSRCSTPAGWTRPPSCRGRGSGSST